MDPYTRDAAYRMTVEAEIRSRLADERWYRAHRWAVWTSMRFENRVALRALLKVARQARKAAALAEEHKEREARRLAESWSESLRAEDATWTNREGMPEFNGSFR